MRGSGRIRGFLGGIALAGLASIHPTTVPLNDKALAQPTPAPKPDIYVEYDVPVFSNRDSQVSVFMVREVINAAFRELKREFTAEEIDAIDTFWATARRLQFETRLHARSEFDDWDEPEKKRLMLRLWLDVERKARPVVREIHIYENVGGRSGIDPQPGRMPAVAKYRAPDAEVRRHAAAE